MRSVREEDALKCPHCENELPEKAKFCSWCGKEVEERREVQDDIYPTPVVGRLAVPEYHLQVVHNDMLHNGLAIASLASGALGCIGTVRPMYGIVLGVLGVIFATNSLRTSLKLIARIGLIVSAVSLAVSLFFWVQQTQRLLNSEQDVKTNNVVEAVPKLATTPCYSLTVPPPFLFTRSKISCDMYISNSVTGEQVNITSVESTAIDSATVASFAQSATDQYMKSMFGWSASTLHATTFALKDGYGVGIHNDVGGVGEIVFVGVNTPKGTSIIRIVHLLPESGTSTLTTMERSWQWAK